MRFSLNVRPIKLLNTLTQQEHELERFRMQAQGAVELQSKYDEAAKKLEALEAEAAFLRQGHARATAVATSSSPRISRRSSTAFLSRTAFTSSSVGF